MSEIFRLCYIDEPWAYFTTRNLADQWGDDWDDAPYEHNAGTPYTWHDRGEPPWEIRKVAFDADLETPRAGHLNSSFSVQQINAGAVPWLRTPSYLSDEPEVVIPAGTTLREFCRLIRKADGTIYEAKR